MTADNQQDTAGANSGAIDRRAMEAGAMVQGLRLDPGPIDIRALAVAAATKAGRYVPGVSTTEEAVDACVIVEGLTEKILELKIDDGGDTKLGSTIEYRVVVLDRDGNEIGTSSSNAVVLGMTPHMWQFHRSGAELADGAYESSGVVNATAMLRGMTQVLHVVGKSGKFEDKAGYLTIVMSDPTQRPPHYTTSLVVC